jgi:hypothetical protein
VAQVTFDNERDVWLPWFHFVNIQKFGIGEAGDDAAVLEALRQHDRYQNGYFGPSGIGEGVHGPYRVDRIAAESFEQVSAPSAVAEVRRWVAIATNIDVPDDAHEWLRAQLVVAPITEVLLREYVYDTISNADVVYRLRELPDEDRGPEGFPTHGPHGFHEFVAIDRAAGSVVLIVCTDD